MYPHAPRTAKPDAARNVGPKIIVQYRKRGGRVYELQSSGAVIALHISRAEGPGTAGSWHIQAQSVPEQEPSSVDGWGETPAEALNDVARAWKSRTPLLAPFDWEAVAKELHVVNAI